MLSRLTGNAEALALAAIGGFFMNMMNLYQDQKRPPSKRTKKDCLYWIFFIFWPVAGAVITYVYLATGTTLQGFSAFLAGLTAPGFLQNLMEKTIPIPESTKATSVGEE